MQHASSLAFLLIFLAVPIAHGGEVSTDPVLRIETGAHGADVPGLVALPDGKRLVSVSLDKTLRIWTPGDRNAVTRVLRVPAESSREGSLYTVAASPDGRTIAAGGWTGEWDEPTWSLYLFDADSGAITRRVGGLPHRVLALAFSPDGRHLAVGFKDRHGVSIYDTKTWTVTARDTDYRDDTTSVHFDRDGRLVAVSLDGGIRLYDARFARLRREPVPGGTRPYIARFAPDGGTIALTYLDTSKVDLLSGADLSLTGSADTRGADKTYTSVVWSADGAVLNASGLSERGGRYSIRRWTLGGRGPYRDIPVAVHAADRIAAFGDGGLAYATSGGALGLLDANGRVVWEQKASIADFRDQQDQFKISADGLTVEFSTERVGGTLLRFSVTDRSLIADPPPDDRVFAATPPPPELTLYEWRERKVPQLNGAPLGLRPHEVATTAAATPGGKGFVVATGWRVVAFAADGKVRWDWQAPDTAWTVNVSRDGRLVVAAFADGTIRWLRLSDGKELASVFVHPDQQRWAAWTPDGTYMASPGGDTLIGWQVNRGKDATADFFTVSRFRDRFYKPEAVERALASNAGAAPQRRGDATPDTAPQARDIAALLPPVVNLLSPRNGTTAEGTRLEIQYELRASGGVPVDLVRVMVNRKPVAEASPPDGKPGAPVRGSISIAAPREDAIVEVIARNERGIFGEPSGAWIRHAGSAAVPAADKPTLYVLSIGISAYASPALKLDYAAKDAEDFTAIVRRQQGRAYRRVESMVLTDAKATGQELLKALRWLAETPGPDDVAILFMAGHGVDDERSGYHFVPQDAAPEAAVERGVSYNMLQQALAKVAGRAFLFLDTCQSGAVWGRDNISPVDTSRIVNDLASPERGIVVFASSSGRLLSYERADWGNGAFTKAVVEGMAGNADLFRNGYVTTSQLDAYVSDRVRKLTADQQRPATGKPVNVDFKLVELR